MLACLAGSAQAAASSVASGGDFVFRQESNVNSLDQHASSTASTRNVAMNISRHADARENNNPITDLAESYTESPDRLTYTFKLRQGVKFHNAKRQLGRRDRLVGSVCQGRTRARHARHVASWDTPDSDTFRLHMKRPQPTFIELISSFSVPIVIAPAEAKDDPAMQLRTIGTGRVAIAGILTGRRSKAEAFRRLRAQYQI